MNALVEFESAHNLLVAIVLRDSDSDSDKTNVESVLKTLITEPTQKTVLKFKVWVNVIVFIRGPR